MKWIGLRTTIFLSLVIWSCVSSAADDQAVDNQCDILLRPQSYSHLATDEASYHLNQQRAQELQGGVVVAARLRIATINLNLVSNLFARNPIYKASRQDMVEELKSYLESSSAPDVVFGQEIWEAEDHDVVVEAAIAAGYEPLVQDGEQMRKTGLQILVRKSLAAVIGPAQFNRFTDASGSPIRAFWEGIGGVHRGLLVSALVFPDGTRITLVNTHMTPLTFHQRERDHQLTALERSLPEFAKDSDGLIFAGDLNIAADYKKAKGAEKRRVQRERKLYEDFYTRFGLVDTFRAVNTKADAIGYTTNVYFPNTLVLRIWPEVEKRIDYIFASELGGRLLVHVEKSQLIFTTPSTLSDHFGIESEIQFFRRTAESE